MLCFSTRVAGSPPHNSWIKCLKGFKLEAGHLAMLLRRNAFGNFLPPTSPYPQTRTCLPPNITSVVLFKLWVKRRGHV